MRVFVTGASGHIGSALVPELRAAGHVVLGLARSEAAARALGAAGAEVVRGSLDDHAVLRDAARAADGVVHLAFKHDIAFSGDYAAAAAADLAAIAALGEALVGSGKPFVGTGGTLLGAVPGERALPFAEDEVPAGGPRADAEAAVVALAERSVRSAVVRLAPTVHSSLDTQGFVPTLVAMARKNGFAAYVGEGKNRWPALHTLDAARLYRRALEAAPAGARLHGVAEEGIAFRAIAEAIGRGLGLPAKSIPKDEAAARLGFLGALAQLDDPTTNARTRELLRWEPAEPGLLADIAAGHYFAES